MENSIPGQFFLYSILVLSLKAPVIGSFSSRAKRSNNFTFTLNLPYADETNTFSLLENVQPELILGLIEVQKTSNYSLSIVCSADSEHLKIVKTNHYMYTIEVSKSLDYETQSQLYVTIECSKFEAPFSQQLKHFTINVQDVNDNTPTFSEPFYLANVTEQVENNSYVTRVTATDADSGINAKIFYSIQGFDGSSISPFVINSITGEIVTNTNTDIDREKATNFTFLVIAIDSGNPSLTGTANILITVEDINDNSPVILTKVLYISENQAVLTEVGFIKAYDADSDKNADVEFRILDDKSSSLSPFTFHSTGLVSATAQLDREQQSNYSFLVQASDKGFPAKTSTSTVLIQVKDENDHTPEFISPCAANESLSWKNHSDVDSYIIINWHEPAGDRLVFQVEATDHDIGENADLHFKIASIAGEGQIYDGNNMMFKMNERSGAISLSRPMRQDDSFLQMVNISVSDQGNPSRTAYCILTIRMQVDLNELVTQVVAAHNGGDSMHCWAIFNYFPKALKYGLAVVFFTHVPNF